MLAVDGDVDFFFFFGFLGSGPFFGHVKAKQLTNSEIDWLYESIRFCEMTDEMMEMMYD